MEAVERKADTAVDVKYIDVLDGVRALSVIFVLLFHFWQQTWIFPRVSTPFLAFLGIERIDLTPLARTGYLFVDMLVLLSGFLLFLPLMRHILLGEPMAVWAQYARKRAARILPSYLFAVLVSFFFFALPGGEYKSAARAARDLLTHLSFTHTLFRDTYFQTGCIGVLWTVAVEVWFYVLFPLIAELLRPRGPDRKKAVACSLAAAALVYAALQGVSAVWRTAVVLREGAYVPILINQLPAFLGVYANGMLGALLFVLIAKHARRGAALSAVCTGLSVLIAVWIAAMIKDCSKLTTPEAQLWQVAYRFRLSAAFTLFLLSSSLSAGWFRFLLSNRLMRFLAKISYNLYIWHQWLAIKLKYDWRIPRWEGDTPPNQLGDRAWMNKYALLITAAAFAAAVLATYLIEKPFSGLILGRPTRQKRARQKHTS